MNRLGEPIFMAVPKHMRTEFGIHLRLESCGHTSQDLEADLPLRSLNRDCLLNLNDPFANRLKEFEKKLKVLKQKLRCEISLNQCDSVKSVKKRPGLLSLLSFLFLLQS